MTTIQMITGAASVLIAGSILILGGNIIRERMEQPVSWARLALYILPFISGLTVLLLLTGSDTASVVRAVTLCSFLPLIAVIDHREMIIPNRLLLWMLIYWVLVVGQEMFRKGGFDLSILSGNLLGGLIGASPILIRLLAKGGIGMGDIKLFTLVGLYVGKENILRALFLSMVLALGVILWKRIRKTIGKKAEISFGPFAAVGTMLMVLMNIPIF